MSDIASSNFVGSGDGDGTTGARFWSEGALLLDDGDDPVTCAKNEHRARSEGTISEENWELDTYPCVALLLEYLDTLDNSRT